MINWAQIIQLEEDVGSEDLADVVSLFLTEVDEAVSALPSVAFDSASDIAAALHFLKGSAFNLGFQKFGEKCAAGEEAAQNGDVSGISFDEIQQLYSASKVTFFAEISDHCEVNLVA